MKYLLRSAPLLAALLMAACAADESDDTVIGGDADGGLNVEEDTGPGPARQCADGVDNDGDGRVDLDDPGCANTADDDESDDPPPRQCSDGEDNDGDGQIDFPADPGCASSQDDDESDDPVPPACANGLDDDSDGYTDYPADPGCGSAFDDDERDDAGPALPQCSNGLDDDGDGWVDLADPGCASPADPREQEMGERPACSNGLDDDGDGIIDFPLEPGCSAAGDEDEADPDVAPQCGNGLDDDRDGLTDYPVDPGCAGVGDRDETDPVTPPACADGQDNDRDGLIDYPADRGCNSAADSTETGNCGRGREPVELEAGRVVRGDTRGASFADEGSCGGRGAPAVVFLYRVERTLEALEISTRHEGTALESTLYVRRGCLDPVSEVACAREPLDGMAGNSLRIESPEPGDYYIFLDGAGPSGGAYALSVEEVPLAACLNGLDDDGDGRVDFPDDPGCAEPDDRDETDPDPLPQCSNDEDDDGDGLVDFPLDRGCRSAADDDEVDLCGQGVAVEDFPAGQPFVLGSTAGGASGFQGSCGGNASPEAIFVYTNRQNAHLTFSVNHPETAGPTLLYVRTQCLGAGTERGCDTGAQGPQANQKGTVRLERAAPGDYYVFVDHQFGLGGQFKLSVQAERLPPGCSDGVDNDGDGFIDGDDPGCTDGADEDERDLQAGFAPACHNGEDDDGDGHIDFPFDPGCAAKGDIDEADPPVAPACSNGRDDDEDGFIDFPADVGCQARGDDDEVNPRQRPQCNNQLDDDDDGVIDYPNDPGCSGPGDLSERNDAVLPACADRQDNDRDGLVDYPFDPGCVAAGDISEVDPAVRPACSNRMDDDGDGVIDFPREPGCASAGDDDEADPGFAPQCANGRDDDGNGRIDWPDDPGCRFAADNVERTDGPVLARCADGVDNDDDGLVDLADPGCEDARDNDEADLPAPPACANGVDDDQDGAIDWPDDDGCAAQGDLCEQPGYGLCDGACVPLLDNPAHCGRCGRACSDGVECIEGRCGELREVVMLCGGSGRQVQEFIRGELREAELRIENGCVPRDDVQAILVSRGGIGQFQGQAAAMRDYVRGGGIVLTEYNIGHSVYNVLLERNVAQGARNGACQDNVQPVVQLSPEDPFWQDNAFVSVGQQSGCGHAVGHLPDLVPLGGWNAQNVSLGYVDIGNGRLWVVESDWQDGEQAFTDRSRDLMAYMIAGGRIVFGR